MSASKENSFSPICSVSLALMRSTAGATTRDKPGPPAKGAFSTERGQDKQEEVAQCKSQQQTSQPCVVEEFFWIGNSIVAFSKWRLGYVGKIHGVRRVGQTRIAASALLLHQDVDKCKLSPVVFSSMFLVKQSEVRCWLKNISAEHS